MKLQLIIRHLLSFGWLRRCRSCNYRGTKCTCDSRHTNVLEHIFYLESRKIVSRRISSHRGCVLSLTESQVDAIAGVSLDPVADKTDSLYRRASQDKTTHTAAVLHVRKKNRPSQDLNRNHEFFSNNPVELMSSCGQKVIQYDSREHSKQRDSKDIVFCSGRQMIRSAPNMVDVAFNPHATMDLQEDFGGQRSRKLLQSQHMQLSRDQFGFTKMFVKTLRGNKFDSSLVASVGSASPSSDMTGSRAWLMGNNLTINSVCEEDDALEQVQGWLDQSTTSTASVYTYNV